MVIYVTSSSRVNKFKDLREGIRDEAGINRALDENKTMIDEEDDFLSFVNKGFKEVVPEPKIAATIEDTLTEAQTFEQIQKESSKEIHEALKNVKSSVGKEDAYNTRMDILNKIRNPETMYTENVENVNVKPMPKEAPVQPQPVVVAPVQKEPSSYQQREPKKKMTLMERLATISPKDDVEKVEQALRQHEEVLQQKIQQVSAIDETSSLEDMLKSIKERDQKEVEKVMQQQAPQITASNTSKPARSRVDKENKESKSWRKHMLHKDKKEKTIEVTEEISEEKNDTVINIVNYTIIVLIIIFIVLCVMILKQLFF